MVSSIGRSASRKINTRMTTSTKTSKMIRTTRGQREDFFVSEPVAVAFLPTGEAICPAGSSSATGSVGNASSHLTFEGEGRGLSYKGTSPNPFGLTDTFLSITKNMSPSRVRLSFPKPSSVTDFSLANFLETSDIRSSSSSLDP